MPAETRSPATPTTRHALVLVVHAHADTRDMYAEYLHSQGYATMVASDGEEALRLIGAADVIVTDLRLPKLDGTTLLQMIRDTDGAAHRLVIVLTASVFRSDRMTAAGAGCDALLPVPCPPDELLRTIRRLLLRGPRRTALRASLSRWSARTPRIA